MVLLLDALRGQLLVEGRGSLFKAVVVVLPAVEIDGQLLQAEPILFCQNKRVVGLPMCDVDWIAEYRAQSPYYGRPGRGGRVDIPGRLKDQGRALGADRRE